MSSVIHILSYFFLCYFLVLDAIYALLFTISFYKTGEYARRVALGGLDTLLQSPFTPPISIIVPAHNEEACIVESVDALRLQEYGQFEIVVVDDGSTDATVQKLTEAYDLVPTATPVRLQVPSKPIRAVYLSRRLPNLVVVSKDAGGCKADASNAGINVARYPLVCVTDADTVLERDALLQTVRPFVERPRETVAVGAIVRISNGCRLSHGRVEQVRTPRNPLAAVQTVEYMRAFIASRTAWSAMNAYFLVSGAFGLFRKEAVVEVGGYTTSGVAEDMDLVLRLHRHFRSRHRRYSISFVPLTAVWTEAPEQLKGLRSQRMRWHRGLLECLWEYKGMLGRPRYGPIGLLALPYLLLFEAGGAVVEMIGYLVIIAATIAGLLSLSGFLLFLALAVAFGIALSTTAVLLDEMRSPQSESAGDLALLLLYTVLENFGYRQLLTVWRFWSMIEVLAGRKATWHTLERKGFKPAQATTRR